MPPNTGKGKNQQAPFKRQESAQVSGDSQLGKSNLQKLKHPDLGMQPFSKQILNLKKKQNGF